MSEMQTAEYQNSKIEIPMNVSLDKLWTALSEEIDAWWLGDFYAVANSKIHLEPKAGGRLYEENAEGESLLWAHIVHYQPKKAISFAGHIMPPFGMPSNTLWRMEVSEISANESKLTLMNSVIGVAPKGDSNLEDGWKWLLQDGLKKYVEES